MRRQARLDLARFGIADRLGLLQRQRPPVASPPQISQTLPRQCQDLQAGLFLGFALRGPRPLGQLRQIALEHVRPALAGVEGVAEGSGPGELGAAGEGLSAEKGTRVGTASTWWR